MAAFVFVDAGAKHVLVTVPGGVEGCPENPYAFERVDEPEAWRKASVRAPTARKALDLAWELRSLHDILVLPVSLDLLRAAMKGRAEVRP
jgi:hypothetical protein